MGRRRGRQRGEIDRLFRDGRIHRGRWMHVRGLPASESCTLISVRKRFGSAVLRNRARRRIRAICREAFPEGLSDTLLMISLADRASVAGYQGLRADLFAAFEALGLQDP